MARQKKARPSAGQVFDVFTAVLQGRLRAAGWLEMPGGYWNDPVTRQSFDLRNAENVLNTREALAGKRAPEPLPPPPAPPKKLTLADLFDVPPAVEE